MALKHIKFLILIALYCFVPNAAGQGTGQDAAALQRLLSSQGQSGLGAAGAGAGGLGGSSLTLPSITNKRQSSGQKVDDKGGDVRAKDQSQLEILRFERIEFQDYVAQLTGRDLPIFGSELFKNVPSTFAPLDDGPVTSEYVIGPGDEILVRAWGQVEIDYSVIVDRSGAITIPKIGTINVAGTKYQDLQPRLKAAIGRIFRNFELSISLGQLRVIQVFVVGQARRPGSYTVSSMSTLVNTVFAAGGPSAKGSMRSVQLKRGNKLVTELDLYDLLIDGDKSKDATLLPGDVIYFPPVGEMVAISGSVNVPAIFELKQRPSSNSTSAAAPFNSLASLVSWAGGFASTAAGQKATVDRIDANLSRKVEEFALDSAGMQSRLRNGDVVNIYAVTPRINNAVSLRGNVAQPARFPWRDGMRVKDLIPRADGLMSRAYWLRKNQAVGLDSSIAELVKRNQAAGVDIPIIDLLRKNLQSTQQELEASVADSMRRTNIAADVAVASADSRKRIATAANDIDQKLNAESKPIAPNARIVAAAGLGASQGMQPGGQDKQDSQRRTKLVDEIKRNLDEVNWNYAVIERINVRDLSTSLIPFNLAKAILEGDPTHNLLLQPGDVVTVFSVDDIQTPVAKQTKYVRLDGEFVSAGVYSVEPGETVRQLIVRVGGLTPNAYLFGAEFSRESTRVFQQKKLEEAVDRLEREIQANSISRSKNATSVEEAAGLAQDAPAQQALIAKLRQVKATGRIVLELPPDGTAGLKDIPDITLEDGDRFTIPSRPSTVNVVGAVYNENAFVYRPEKKLSDYLNQAGGVALTGNKGDVYLVRVDGTVISKRQGGWLSAGFDGERLMPGDTIVVPEDFDRTTWTKVFKDYGQILYQFALGAAAFKVLK